VAPEKAARADLVLQGVELSLTDPDGLPGRPGYRHLIYCPWPVDRYGAKTLPGIREAIEGRRWAEAGLYIKRTAAALDAAATKLDAARAAILQ